MEVAAVVLQQAQSQTNAAMAMIKKNAQADKAIADLVQQAVSSGSRGQNLDITI